MTEVIELKKKLEDHARTVAVFAALLFGALALTFATGQAGAVPCSTCDGGGGDNSPPTISASSTSVAVSEGRSETNSGTYSDPDGNSTVTLSASVGNVTKDAAGDGTWSWSFATDDGPAQSQTVTITATDSATATASTSFTLTVNNVNPTATFNAPQTSYAGKYFIVSMTDPSDPSSADRAAGFTYAFDCGRGSGYGAFTGTSVASCQAGSAGTSQTVRGKIRDKDDGVREYTRTVTINAAPPPYPNGKIAFHSGIEGEDHEIYAMNADGSNETQLTDNSLTDIDPAFSPDGSKIAFLKGEYANSEIYTINAAGLNADGSGETRLTSNTKYDDAPSWGGAGETTPPETSLDPSGPSGTVTSTSAGFSFSSEANSIFECKLDGGAFERCESPKAYSNLSEGEHTFQVRGLPPLERTR